MRKLTLLLLILPLIPLTVFGQVETPAADEKVVTFKFLPGQDMFYIPYGGNDAELNRLYNMVEEYQAEITTGGMPVFVDGYCASGESAEASFKIAIARSNRVKSELITNKGLVEDNFITKNHTTTYTALDGKSYRDMVVVTLRIPAKVQQRDDAAERERLVREREAVEKARREQQQREQAEREKAERERAERERAEAEARQAQAQTIVEPAAPSKPYCFAVRTNLLYDAFLLPTLGVEWRVNNNIGIKLDGSYSHWGDEKGKVQKIWLINPEMRWYLLDNKRFYVGASANFGEYNIYKYMLGGLFSDDTGYQGKLWGAGLTVGYQLYLSRSFSLDFNLGLGYTNLEYDSFNIVNETRVYKDKNKSKDFWGPTQAGISLIWTIGGSK